MKGCQIDMNVRLSKPEAKAKRGFLAVLNRYSAIIGLLVVVVVMSVLSPVFLTSLNLLSVIRQVSVIGLLAIGETLVVLTGEIDLSVGSVLALSGVAAAMAQKAGLGVAMSIAAALLVGGTAGLIVGLIVGKGHVPSFVATLGMMGVARGVSLVLTQGFPISGFSQAYKWIGAGEVAGVPVPMIILIALTVVMGIVLRSTPFGRNLYALGGSRKAAFYSGIDVEKEIIKVFVLSGMFAGLGGVVLTARLDAAETVAGLGYESNAIASVVIGGASLSGGVGSVYGTLIGTLLIGVIGNGLTLLAVSSYWQQIVQGAIIVLAVLLDQLRKRNTGPRASN